MPNKPTKQLKISNMGIIKFTKMHGLGNDYIYIDCFKGIPDDPNALSRAMSPRHTSVGSDGIILILPSDIADFKMRIINSDGSEALMCGNGSRCVAKYVYDHHLTDKTDITLETLSGVKHLKMEVDKATGKVTSVTVDMGQPSFECSKIPVNSSTPTMIDAPVETAGETFNITAVSMGNPHGVIFVNTNLATLELSSIGPKLENHTIWPNRANIEFIQVENPHTLKMRVWERGSGETMACGTGACAAAVAAVKTGRACWPVTVKLPGGSLHIDCTQTGSVLMTGPAVEVYSGIFDTDDLK